MLYLLVLSVVLNFQESIDIVSPVGHFFTAITSVIMSFVTFCIHTATRVDSR